MNVNSRDGNIILCVCVSANARARARTSSVERRDINRGTFRVRACRSLRCGTGTAHKQQNTTVQYSTVFEKKHYCAVQVHMMHVLLNGRESNGNRNSSGKSGEAPAR